MEENDTATRALSVRPACDMCGAPAYADAKTVYGPWAYLCEHDFHVVGIGLGLGRGQRLIIDE